MMELETVPQPAHTQADPKRSEDEVHSSKSGPISLTKWKPRRRGACGTCKLKKVRCDGGTPCVNCRRSNQKCEYTLTKKHQASKKSVGIMAPGAELPKNGQTSLVLTKPSQGSPVNSNDTVLDHAHASTSHSHSAQSLIDDCSNDNNWSFDFNWEGILHPPGDIENTLNFQKFSWPVLDANIDDDDLDFDVPVTADGLVTLNHDTPVTTLHDENPPYLSPLSNSFHWAEGPGDWAKMVITNDKAHSYSRDRLGTAGDLCTNYNPRVMAKSFIDPIPSINFSSKPIFSWQDCSNAVSNDIEQDNVQRIFSRISVVNNQQTPMNDSEENQRTYASWYWNDSTLMERCVNACFEQPLGVPNFLTRSLFQDYIKEARGSLRGNSFLLPLIDSVMAFGYYAFRNKSRRYVTPSERKEADCYSGTALSSQVSVLRSPDTLVKLQTLLAMIVISERTNEAAHDKILSGAINCARTLKLENGDMINSNYRSCDERDLAKRALWFLYSIEVPHSLRNGISPSLDRDWIDFAPPHASTEPDWFRIQCLYALVIGSAATLLYSQRGLRQSAAKREHKLDLSFKLLEDWRRQLPPSLTEIHKADVQGIMTDQDVYHVALCMFRQYHEAVFLIFFPWTSKQSQGKITEEMRRKGFDLCVNSAQVVLTTANQVASLEVLDSKFLSLISMSICMTFLDVASSSGTQKGIAYLSMGCGIFGRINLDIEVPLSEVLELTRIAQQLKQRNC